MGRRGESKLENRIKKIVRQEDSSHQKVISILAKRLRRKHPDSKILKNFYYENCASGEKGEYDLIAYVGFYNGNRRYALIFEVKTSRAEKSKKRAVNQLRKNAREARDFCGDDVRCFCFSVYSSNNYFRNTKWSCKPYKLDWIRKLD